MIRTGGTIMKALLSPGPLLKSLINQRIAGIQSYPVPATFKDIEMPERKRPRVVMKNPQYPPGIRVFTMQKRLKLMRGPELHHNTLLYKQYGIVVRELELQLMGVVSFQRWGFSVGKSRAVTFPKLRLFKDSKERAELRESKDSMLQNLRSPRESNSLQSTSKVFLHLRGVICISWKHKAAHARGGGRLKFNHFEMIRYSLLRTIFPNQKDAFAIWRVQDPWQPISKKSQGMRMGGGKGGIDHYATPVKSGQIVVEVGGPFEYFEVKHYLQNIANRLPFAAEAVSYQKMLIQDRQKIKLQEKNLNPWTWKYIIQNKMLGCQNWISKYDKKWYMEYL